MSPSLRLSRVSTPLSYTSTLWHSSKRGYFSRTFHAPPSLTVNHRQQNILTFFFKCWPLENTSHTSSRTNGFQLASLLDISRALWLSGISAVTSCADLRGICWALENSEKHKVAGVELHQWHHMPKIRI